MTRGLWAWGLILVAACAGSEETDEASPGDSSDTATAGVPLADSCPGGVAPLPFDPAEGGLQFGDLAGDFTVAELDGSTFTLSRNWTGCDSFVFVTYFEGAEGDALWSSDVSQLLVDAPANVHFFFSSDERGPARREARVEQIRDALALRPRQRDRVHFVVDRFSDIEGSVGALATDYLSWRQGPDAGVDLGDRGVAGSPLPYFLGIDGDQRWDAGGNVDEFVGGPPSLHFAAWLPHFYNHKRDLAHRLGEEAVTEVVLLDEVVTDRVFILESALPADLSSFDTLEFDVGVNCAERNPFACSEWDRIASIQLCLDGAECTDRRELVRWITPYWRRGSRRWAMDASQLLGLLDGGPTTFRVEMGPGWERPTERHTRITARLSTRGGPRATGAERVYTGGSFGLAYDESHPPVLFTPPASASKVELMLILSGHGQSSDGFAAVRGKALDLVAEGKGTVSTVKNENTGEELPLLSGAGERFTFSAPAPFTRAGRTIELRAQGYAYSKGGTVTLRLQREDLDSGKTEVVAEGSGALEPAGSDTPGEWQVDVPVRIDVDERRYAYQLEADFDLGSSDVQVLAIGVRQQGANCAEWCDHRHQFTINGTEVPEVRSEGSLGTLDCALEAANGVPPGQWGNWAPLRAYWCPGLPVAPITRDLTEHVTPGEPNELDYAATWGTSQPAGGNIALSAYVVWYE